MHTTSVHTTSKIVLPLLLPWRLSNAVVAVATACCCCYVHQISMSHFRCPVTNPPSIKVSLIFSDWRTESSLRFLVFFLAEELSLDSSSPPRSATMDSNNFLEDPLPDRLRVSIARCTAGGRVAAVFRATEADRNAADGLGISW